MASLAPPSPRTSCRAVSVRGPRHEGPAASRQVRSRHQGQALPSRKLHFDQVHRSAPLELCARAPLRRALAVCLLSPPRSRSRPHPTGARHPQTLRHNSGEGIDADPITPTGRSSSLSRLLRRLGKGGCALSGAQMPAVDYALQPTSKPRRVRGRPHAASPRRDTDHPRRVRRQRHAHVGSGPPPLYRLLGRLSYRTTQLQVHRLRSVALPSRQEPEPHWKGYLPKGLPYTGLSRRTSHPTHPEPRQKSTGLKPRL